MTKFFEGKPCTACNATARYVSSGGCVACITQRMRLRAVAGKRKTDSARYYAAHRERLTRTMKEQYAENPQLYKDRSRSYQRRNPVVGLASKARRKARKLGSLSTLDSATERDIRQSATVCYYCRAPLAEQAKTPHLDHMTPLSRGGAHSADNVTMACSDCNLEKHTMTAQEYQAYRERGRP